MGLTRVSVKIANPSDLDTTETLELLVDSGASHSVIPRAILERLGIQPHSERPIRIADGSIIDRELGGASVKYGDRIGTMDVIFGNPEDSRLLGTLTLESLGLGLDPTREELMELPTLM